jgi:hypothetical protein
MVKSNTFFMSPSTIPSRTRIAGPGGLDPLRRLC